MYTNCYALFCILYSEQVHVDYVWLQQLHAHLLHSLLVKSFTTSLIWLLHLLLQRMQSFCPIFLICHTEHVGWNYCLVVTYFNKQCRIIEFLLILQVQFIHFYMFYVHMCHKFHYVYLHVHMYMYVQVHTVQCLCTSTMFMLQHPRHYHAKDLFQMVAQLIRSEGEITEVVISALGLANPAAFLYDYI